MNSPRSALRKWTVGLGFALVAALAGAAIAHYCPTSPSRRASDDVPEPSLSTDWVVRGPGGGGAFFSPAPSPHAEDVVFVSTDMGSVYRTATFGSRWETIPFRSIQGGSHTPVAFTSDPKLIYAIDGTDDRGMLVRSSDGGRSFEPVAREPPEVPLTALYTDPRSLGRVAVGHASAVLYQNGEREPLREIHRGDAVDLVGASFSESTILLASRRVILVSTDSGQSFTHQLYAGIPANLDVVSYARIVEGDSATSFALAWERGAFGSPWTSASLGAFRGLYVQHGMGPWQPVSGIDPAVKLSLVATAGTGAPIAYFAGGNTSKGTPVILRTSDAGRTLTHALRTHRNGNVSTASWGDRGPKGWSFGEYVLGLSVRPGDPSRLVFTDLGGVYVSKDGGATFHQAVSTPSSESPPGCCTPKTTHTRTSGLEPTSVWHLAFLDRSTLFASYSDITAAVSTDGGLTWTRSRKSGLSLNSTFASVVARDGTLWVGTSSVHDIYQSTYLTDDELDRGTGQIARSRDKGQTFEIVREVDMPVVHLALDRTDANLYFSAVHSTRGGVYRMPLVGPPRIEKLAVPSATEGHPYTLSTLADGSLLVSYSGRREGTRRHRGAFRPSSGVFLSEDGGRSFVDRSSFDMRGWTKDVVVDRHDPTEQTFYACVFQTNGRQGGLFRTTDRGRTWSRISERTHVESITLHPTNPHMAYMTTETEGLFRTTNLRAAAPTFEPVQSYPFRQPLRVFYNPFDDREVWATSFGGGLRVHREAP